MQHSDIILLQTLVNRSRSQGGLRCSRGSKFQGRVDK